MEEKSEITMEEKRKQMALLQIPINKWKQAQGKQLSSFILFISVVIFVNLCPFHLELSLFDNNNDARGQLYLQSRTSSVLNTGRELNYLDQSVEFLKLVFTNPVSFERHRNSPARGIQLADARVIGKMAKVWYIKKKIKKLSKKLKKHTIAVPVFTAIPIYEHSYYPQPHVTHVSHTGLHHAASSYAPAVTQASLPASQTLAATAGQQMATAASSNHQQMVHPYRPMLAGHHHHHHSGYNPMASGAHHIINSYAPSPPLYVDEAGGIYGHYGNAYGRYDGGYQFW